MADTILQNSGSALLIGWIPRQLSRYYIFYPPRSTHISQTNTCSNLTKFSVHVTCGHGLILWWQCNLLYTYSFVDAVVFSDNRAHVVCGVWWGWQLRDVSQRSGRQCREGQNFSSAPPCLSASHWLTSLGHKPRDTQWSLAVEANIVLRMGTKSAIVNCLVCWCT